MPVPKRRIDRTFAVILGAVWVPLGLGCILIGPRPSNNGDGPPPVEDSGCSDDHAEYWAPDSAGAEVSNASADVDCNQIQHFEGGGAQGASTFHIEPTLRVTNPDLSLPEAPSITWRVMRMSGEVINEQGFELYEEDIVRDANGFSVTSRFFIDAGMRGKNFRIYGEMELIDSGGANAAAGTDAGTDAGFDAGSGSGAGEPVTVQPEAAVYVSPDPS